MQMYDGEMNDEYIWAQAYLAVLSAGRYSREAATCADLAVADFNERFNQEDQK